MRGFSGFQISLMVLAFGTSWAAIIFVILAGGLNYRIEQTPGQVSFHKSIASRLFIPLAFGGLTSALLTVLFSVLGNDLYVVLAFCLPFVYTVARTGFPDTVSFDLTERVCTRIEGWPRLVRPRLRLMSMLYGIYGGCSSYRGVRYYVGIAGPDLLVNRAVFERQYQAEEFAREMIALLDWRPTPAPSPIKELRKPILRSLHR